MTRYWYNTVVFLAEAKLNDPTDFTYLKRGQVVFLVVSESIIWIK